MAEWLERVLAVREVSDSISGREGNINAVVGILLTTSIFAGLSIDSGSILSIKHDTKPRTI